MKVKTTTQQGFTIVELLIVIVVIAILAAITIVAYNGVQNRGKTTSAQSLADSIAKKAEAWNAIATGYPTYCQLATNTIDASGAGTGTGAAGCTAGTKPGPTEAKLDNPSAISAVATEASDGSAMVQYAPASSACARVNFWNFSTSSLSTPMSEPHSVLVGTGC